MGPVGDSSQYPWMKDNCTRILAVTVSVRSRSWHRLERKAASQISPLEYKPNTFLAQDMGVSTIMTGVRWSKFLFFLFFGVICYFEFLK